MIRFLVAQAVVVGIFVPTGAAYAQSLEHKVGKTDWEQARPLWSLCEPHTKRQVAAIPLKGRRQGPVAPTDVVVPSWSDCEGIEGPQRAEFEPSVRSGGGMSSQFDDDDEAPICDGGTRCSPVPTEGSRAVTGLTFAKAIFPPSHVWVRRSDFFKAPPASIGMADDGFPVAPFVPPRPAG